MIILFKGLTAGYFISVFAGIAAIFALFEIPGIGDLFGILALIWVLFCAFFFNRAANQKFVNINNIMFEQCECRKYIAEYNRLFARSTKRTKDFLLLNLATGYICFGDFEKAFSILNEVNPFFKDNNLGRSCMAIYYNNLLTVYRHFADNKNAESALNMLRAMLSNPKFKPALKVRINNIIDFHHCISDIEQGNYENAEKVFLDELSSAESRYDRVAINYYLAKIYSEKGETEKAEECISFVIQNGGDTFCVQKAKELRG